MNLSETFPPLYECSVCGCAVTVTPMGEGREPTKAFSCDHVTATIWANRKVTLRGKGALNANGRPPIGARIRLTVRQLLSALTGRSI